MTRALSRPMIYIRRALLLVWPLALLVFIFERPLIAGLCPPCFGLSEIDQGIWTDTDDPQHQQNLITMARSSQSVVERHFGQGSSRTRLLICTTDDCDTRIGATGPRGLAYGSFMVKIAPHGVDAIIVTHELTHVARRSTVLGPLRRVTAWQEEGIADWVAKGPALADCEVSGDLPSSARDWRSRGRDLTLYADAHCAVSKLIAEKGVQAVLKS